MYPAANEIHSLPSQIFKKHPLQSLNTTCKINETLTGLNESWSSETEFQSELQRILNEQQGSEEEVAEPNTVGGV